MPKNTQTKLDDSRDNLAELDLKQLELELKKHEKAIEEIKKLISKQPEVIATNILSSFKWRFHGNENLKLRLEFKDFLVGQYGLDKIIGALRTLKKERRSSDYNLLLIGQFPEFLEEKTEEKTIEASNKSYLENIITPTSFLEACINSRTADEAAALKKIFELTMNNLEPESRINVLKSQRGIMDEYIWDCTTNHSWFWFVHRNDPGMISEFIESVASSDIELNSKYEILKLVYEEIRCNEISIDLKHLTELTKVFWLKDIRNLLMQLKDEDVGDKSDIYTSLNTEFETYLASKKNLKDFIKFQTNWNTKIDEARQKDMQTTRPQVNTILTTMALIISVVGIIYLAYNAIKNFVKNRSMFFPSRLEDRLNALQDKLSEHNEDGKENNFPPSFSEKT